MEANLIMFRVAGIPAPQGSKRPVRLGNGRVGMVESSRAVGPWRDAVRTETQQHMTGRDPLQGAVSVSLLFWLARPSSAPRARTHPVTRPDLDKLVRSTLDGLRAGGAFEDDSQVVELACRKEYGTPGCDITVTRP